MIFGALEAGGTKMVMAIGNGEGEIIEIKSIPTGSFGPIDLNRNSETYCYITSTPKLAWASFDLVGSLKAELQIPIGVDTDVNASVLGEATWGCLKGLSSGIYITVGTGSGIGIYVDKELLHGMLHPEGGHILLNKHPMDSFQGVSP